MDQTTRAECLALVVGVLAGAGAAVILFVDRHWIRTVAVALLVGMALERLRHAIRRTP